MQIQELIKTRRSIKLFKNTEVSIELLTDLLNIAIYAPNHKMTEPWRFVILHGASKEEYAELKKRQSYEKMEEVPEEVKQKAAEATYVKIHNVPVILFVVMKVNEDALMAEEDHAACACIVENFMLLAWDKGIGTAWKTYEGNEQINALLQLTEDEKVVNVTYIGYPESIPDAKPRTSLENRIIVKS